IGEPGVPGGTHALLLLEAADCGTVLAAGDGGDTALGCWATAAAPAMAVNAINGINARNATLLRRRWFGVATMQASTVSNLPHGIHVGCSGWVYKHWRGIFYPEGLPQKRWFERYTEEFDTVEINASFYRLPLAST